MPGGGIGAENLIHASPELRDSGYPFAAVRCQYHRSRYAAIDTGPQGAVLIALDAGRASHPQLTRGAVADQRSMTTVATTEERRGVVESDVARYHHPFTSTIGSLPNAATTRAVHPSPPWIGSGNATSVHVSARRSRLTRFSMMITSRSRSATCVRPGS